MTREPLEWGCKDLAAFLGVPLETVYYWRKHGEGPQGYQIGRQIRFRPSEVEAWLKQRRETQTPRPSSDLASGRAGRDAEGRPRAGVGGGRMRRVS